LGGGVPAGLTLFSPATGAPFALQKRIATLNTKNDKNGWQKQGWIRIPRGWQDDPLFKKRRRFSAWEAWLDIYMNARGTDLKPPDPPLVFNKRCLWPKRGQLYTSQKDLARRWGWDRGSVRKFLRKLIRRGSIEVETAKGPGGHSLITVLNYDEPKTDNKSIWAIGQQRGSK
jgi:hypothetical protein